MAEKESVKYMLYAGLFFALMNVCVKYISHLPTAEVVFFRSIFTLIATYAILKKQRIPILGSKNNRMLLILRGTAGSIGLIGSFYTLQHIPLATAVTLNYLSPFFTAVLGIFIVNQPIKPIQIVYIVIAILGVVMLKGFDIRVSTLDVLIGLAAALFAGIAYNIISKIKTSEHPLVIMFYFPLITIPVVGIYMLFNWKTPEATDWLILLLIGIFTQMAQYFMTLSYQRANLAKVASLNYLGVIYALLFGYFLFQETFTTNSLIGIFLILCAVLLNIKK